LIMKAPRFKGWSAKLPSLNQPQRRQVLDALHPAAGLDQVVALIDEVRAPFRCCPRCGNARCYRHGFANDLQRCRCCACGRTFNYLTCMPLARLRLKAKWVAYSQVLLDSLPVRKAADRSGVHRNTAFRWRHRFLHWVKLDRPAALNGIVEADETFCRDHKKVRARSIGHYAIAAVTIPNGVLPVN
jgi:transposase-like protein